ncbi:MAG: transketolase [Eubacteriales bacterium]|nr:transketolase [Eubacteriales bacterium]
MKPIDQKCINAIRILSADGVQKANSGHPGLPMGSAPMAYTLFAKEMKYNPANPKFADRDRFILSAGHGSMLLYSALHLFGYDLPMSEIQNFRQFGSKTPGHPEYGHTPGVETTTGPLGQGIATAVGFALAEAHLAAKFNKPDIKIVDHYTYVLMGDGCMMEGIESEAASLAGTWGLGKLIAVYDSNKISIEGDTDIAFRENVAARHEAQGWHVQIVEDGNDIDAFQKAVENAKAVSDKPSLIICKTQIGFGCPAKQGKASAHGEPLGAENLAATRANLGWTEEPFVIPADVYAETRDKALARGKKAEAEYEAKIAAYAKKYPEDYKLFCEYFSEKLPVDLVNDEAFWTFENKKLATRVSSFEVINKLAKILPNMIGGSADLAPSNKSNMKEAGEFAKENYAGSNLHFGVREHAMASITNGLILHGGLRAYCATFFVFSDYMKNSMRLAALMNIPAIYVLTHDSIGVGEDGPTHEPVEQLIALRSIPNMTVYRPADSKETAAAYCAALTKKSPTAIVLTRQNLPQYAESGKAALKGGYVMRDAADGKPDVILMASGSEVEQIYAAYDVLAEQGIKARVVSMPSFEMFEAQSEEYKESVLPKSVRARVAVEAGSPYSWYKYTGLDGEVIGMSTFGASAPASQLFQYYGFTVDNVVATAKKVLGK